MSPRWDCRKKANIRATDWKSVVNELRKLFFHPLSHVQTRTHIIQVQRGENYCWFSINIDGCPTTWRRRCPHEFLTDKITFLLFTDIRIKNRDSRFRIRWRKLVLIFMMSQWLLDIDRQAGVPGVNGFREICLSFQFSKFSFLSIPSSHHVIRRRSDATGCAMSQVHVHVSARYRRNDIFHVTITFDSPNDLVQELLLSKYNKSY